MMRIMVLSDGETFSNLDGCAIYEVPDGEIEDIENLLSEDSDLQPLRTFWELPNGEWGER